MILNEDNFLIYAAKYYDNPNCTSMDEFEEDLNRIKYLKKLFHLYVNKGVLKERLILNHLLILYNVFEARACTKLLLLRLEEYHTCLLPFVKMLGYLPDYVYDINQKGLYEFSRVMDNNVINKLRELQKSD